MTAALRLARLFELRPDQTAELNEISKLIHQNHDLNGWRPWWPSVSEVWQYQGNPPEKIQDMYRAWHLQAWAVLEGVLDDYKTATSAHNIRARG